MENFPCIHTVIHQKNMKTRISSPELMKLIEEVHNCLIERPANLSSLKVALEDLFDYLTTQDGRTEDNCKEADLYFCLHDDNGFNWDHLPEDYKLIIDDIGGQLHDSIKNPEISENFKSSPEQLLKRIRNLKIKD